MKNKLILLTTLSLFNSIFINAQKVDIFKMTPEERKAYREKINAETEKNYQATLKQMNIQIPTLPSEQDDPKRPQNTAQRPGSSWWFDADSNVHIRSAFGNWSNYREDNTGSYTLPDPLVLKNGKAVKNASDWWTKRRPEILSDYENFIYGKTPANTPKVTFEITSTDSNALDGKAIKKIIVGHIDNSSYASDTPEVLITMYIPKGTTKRLPLMVTVGGFLGAFPGANPKDVTALDLVIAKGWAIATVNTNNIQADNGAGLTKGIIGLMNKGQQRKPDEWGVLAAWSWGMSRAMDYFETDPTINAQQIGIEGHSRWGKTAMLTAALDKRWAVVYASCSGAMGASLEKRNFGEIVDIVAGSGLYHWMAPNFLRYANNVQNMPVDAHELISLVAPRPMLVTGGSTDKWADPKGEFLACVAASPVYELLGKYHYDARTRCIAYTR